MKQFSQMANLYFLLLTLMECIPAISDSGGYPVLAFPLSFVVGMSMIKDIYEDYNRHQSDKEENNRKSLVLKPDYGRHLDAEEPADSSKASVFVPTFWKDIQVGSIVKVYENEYFPCDLVVLNSSLPKGMCYVETKNLDGETNLKHKLADKEAIKLAQNDLQVLRNFSVAEIECEKENASIYTFAGQLKVKGTMCPIDIENVLLRGSSLRNTEWIYGVAVYTGHDTKVMMNSTNSKTKQSKIEKESNWYIVMTIIIQIAISLQAAIFASVWSYQNRDQGFWYLELQESMTGESVTKSLTVSICVNFGKWFMNLMNFVSISLLVSLEMVKFVQG